MALRALHGEQGICMHLRIRAAILREAIEETEGLPGGQWRLLHLKGSELLADGLTKQLNGQAFFRFVEDLRIRRGRKSTSKPCTEGYIN